MITLFTFFLLCSIAGGAVLTLQLLASVLGMGGDDLDGPDLDLDVDGHSDTGFLFGLLSFRTMVAALTFFGLFGLLANTLEMYPILQVGVGMIGGTVALLATGWLLRGMRNLSQDGTIRLDRAVGVEGTVYTPIPGNGRGAGKVMLNFHGRVEEYAAVTSHFESLPSGMAVRVVAVRGESLLEVEQVLAAKPAPLHATPSSSAS